MLAATALCSGVATAAAVLLWRRLDAAERAAVAVLVVLFVASALLAPRSYVHDHLVHFQHARDALRQPALFLSTWDRPAFMLLYAAPASLGLRAARLFSAVPATVAIAATMLAARRLPVGAPWLAGVLVGAQLDFFGQASSTMTELLFAAGFAVAVWGWVEERPWIVASGLAAVAISRPEGPLFAAVGAAGLAWRHRRVAPALAVFAPFAVFLAAGAVATGDALWYLHQNAYREASNGARLRLELRQLRDSFFYTALRDSQPPVLLALELAGGALAATRLRRSLGFLLVPLAMSWLLLTFLRIGEADWWRQSRYLVTLAPALALLAAAGLEAVVSAVPRAGSLAVLLGAALSAALTLVEHRRLPVAWSAPGTVVLAAALAGVAALLWRRRERVPPAASLAGMLLLPLAAAPPGAFSRHLPTPGERLDAAAARWIRDRSPSPPAVSRATPSFEQACRVELGDPCPLPAPPSDGEGGRGTLRVEQFVGAAAPSPPPGWELAWAASDGEVRGPLLRPHWRATAEVVWRKR